MSLTKFYVNSSDNLALFIARRTIESGDLTEPLSVLESLLESRANVLKMRDRISLFVDGYNDDSRELWDIPEVRRFLSQLDEKFPYWFWFSSKKDQTLKVLIDCLCEFKKFANKRYMMDDQELTGYMRCHYRALDDLCERYNLSATVRTEVLAAIEQYYNQYYTNTTFFMRLPILGDVVTSKRKMERPYAYERCFPEIKKG